jgi:phosphoserine phosphatase RsbU/P
MGSFYAVQSGTSNTARRYWPVASIIKSIKMHRGKPVSTKPALPPGTGEITRDSLAKILEIMGRLAMPGALPELLQKIIDVGRQAIVAEAGLLWLHDTDAGELQLATPNSGEPVRVACSSPGLLGDCVTHRRIINTRTLQDGSRFHTPPPPLNALQTRSVLTVPVLGQNNDLLGIMQWLGVHAGQFDHHDEWLAPALAAQSAIAIQHALFTERALADAKLHQEVAVAREIQMGTLPGTMPNVPGYDLCGRFLPTDHTGGDLFDLVMLDHQLFLLLGDATGHGFGPALSATQMQAMLRVAFRLGADLNSAYAEVNNQLCEDLPDDRFITAFTGFLDPAAHEVRYHSGGQGPILHYRAEADAIDWYKPNHFPLGAMEMRDIGEPQILSLAPGDILALISDGVYEFTNPGGEVFGEERVGRVIRENRDRSMAELGEQIIAAAFAYGDGAAQADDITLVMAKRLS